LYVLRKYKSDYTKLESFVEYSTYKRLQKVFSATCVEKILIFYFTNRKGKVVVFVYTNNLMADRVRETFHRGIVWGNELVELEF